MRWGTATRTYRPCWPRVTVFAALIPSRNTELFHWRLNNGLRVVKQMNLMSIDLYNEPQDAWLPSISH